MKNFKNEENKILAKKNLISKEEINKELNITRLNFKNIKRKIKKLMN